MVNTFIWADLSTFNIKTAKTFYKKAFNWRYREIDEGYFFCETNGNPSAGLYTMPEKFQKINMPSFWMSYLQVDNIEQTVLEAEKHGAKIEIKPQSGLGGGKVALIRDPAGAGFTCYEGDSKGLSNSNKGLGHAVWNELHVSDLSLVKSFYENVFGWIINEAKSPDRYEIFTSEGTSKPIAGIKVTSNELKGDKEYWGVYFSVDNVAKASESLEREGGQIIVEQVLGKRPAFLVYDSQGAAFYIVENNCRSKNKEKPTAISKTRWRAILGLVLLATAILFDANWIWGLLFLFWLIPDIKNGSTHFIELVERRSNPFVYWLIISTWSFLSIYLLLSPLIDKS